MSTHPEPAHETAGAIALAVAAVDELIRCGLREVVLAPGSRSAPLAMEFFRRAELGDLRLNVRIDERSAAFTALGLAKASRAPVAVVCTSGTAAAHFHAAVIEADESCVPMLVLTADRPPELRGTGANQTIDQLRLYGPAVRWFSELGTEGRLATGGRRWRERGGWPPARLAGLPGRCTSTCRCASRWCLRQAGWGPGPGSRPGPVPGLGVLAGLWRVVPGARRGRGSGPSPGLAGPSAG